ncbi:OmpA family protein [Reinekea blandensis]|uniref:Chemotaxis MotB protein, putative n=1 Tax=Reinekea blandensis MED297 TaxID=314283 RepID=A4BJ08_9GAMM|nr:OmpA family protein [Reinekea blandensis]EAR07853.1 chemotaxis MotB protein, putative [Reinekea sp. MED297] [Reinekea blandensis MED297]
MQYASQRGWIAWSLSLILLVAGSAVSWFYWTQTQQLTDTQNENQALQSRVSRLEQQLEQTRSQLQSAEQQRQTLTQARNQLTNELDQLRSAQNSVQSQQSQLQAQLSTKNQEVEQLQATLTATEARLQEINTNLEVANQLIAEQQGALDEAATTEERFLAARQQLALEQAENETYSETVERLRQEMAAETAAMNALEAQLQTQLSQLNQEKEKLVTQLEDGTTAIKLPESILFASGRADINAEGRQSLANLATALSSFPNHLISIQGHTDSQTIAPATAEKYPTNWELSAARAASAVRELLKQGIPADQMQAVGYADTRPLVEETSAQTRQQNRRIEVILLPNQFTTRVLEETPG